LEYLTCGKLVCAGFLSRLRARVKGRQQYFYRYKDFCSVRVYSILL
jgi:hypothetical protein